MLVRREAVVGAGLDEHGAAFTHRNVLALDVQHTGALQNDVDLVILVWLLPVGLRRDEDVDAELEAGGLVNDLIASAGLLQPLPDSGELERVHARDATSPAR